MLIRVKREYMTPCTAGMMTIENDSKDRFDLEIFGPTLERPWLNNQIRISCIPAGRYEVAITFSARFQREMLEILNVPGRGGIRIHGANEWRQLEGCLAVGTTRPTRETIYGSKVLELEGLVRDEKAIGKKTFIQIDDPEVESVSLPDWPAT